MKPAGVRRSLRDKLSASKNGGKRVRQDSPRSDTPCLRYRIEEFSKLNRVAAREAAGERYR